MDTPIEESFCEDVTDFANINIETGLTNTWTDEDTEGEDTGDGTFRDEEDAFPTDTDIFQSLESSSEWAESECGDVAGANDSGKRSYADAARMFKLRKNLDQLDSFHKQKELNVLKAREELGACRTHVAELIKERDEVEEDIEKEKQAENSAAVFRLRALHRRLCLELQGEEDLEAHVGMVLKEHELELCRVEVELGRFLGLRQEVEREEQDFLAQKEVQRSRRLRREEMTAQRARLRVQQVKIGQEEALREQQELQQRRLEQARRSRQKAARHLKQTLIRMHEKEKESEKKRGELMKKRMEAAMSLKANIAATQESLRAHRAREKTRVQRQKEEEKRVQESLQAEGFNSTKVLLLHKKQEEFNKKKVDFDEKQRAKRMEIASKLLREEELEERQRRRHAMSVPPMLANSEKASAQWKAAKRLLKCLEPPPPPDTQPPPQLEGHQGPRPFSRAGKRGGSSSSEDECDEAAARAREGGENEEDGGVKESLAEPEFTGLWDVKPRGRVSRRDEVSAGRPVPSSSVRTHVRSSTMEKALGASAPKKAVCGKELKGPPFTSKPEVIHFKDFDVGKTYKKKAVLTNVSYSINTCKLLGVSNNLAHFISISFEPPGPMSAGMACEVEIVFKPMLNEDLEGHVQFQSAAGPFSVPIKCSTKICDMVVDSSLIDFGTHVAGQTISRAITLTNRGALSTRYTLAPLSSNHLQPQRPIQHTSTSTQLKVSDDSSRAAASDEQEVVGHRDPGEEQSEKGSQEPSPHPESQLSGGSPESSRTPVHGGVPEPQVGSEAALSEQAGAEGLASVQEDGSDVREFHIGEAGEGEVGPFSSVKIPVDFTPTVPGEAELDLRFVFSLPCCEPIPISVRGTTVSAPVWVAQPSIDLKICTYDRLYQDSIVVHSRASTALKLTFKVCKELRKHMEICPKTGYVQAKSIFHAQLKFLPRCTLPEDTQRCFDKDTGVLEVPLAIQVADQVRPVPFTVHAIVSTSDLELDRTEVDFGHCTVYESVRTSVRLTNHSMLPQDFGFLGIPKEYDSSSPVSLTSPEFMDIQPNDGFGTLLPLQSLEIDLIFSAPKAGEYNAQLICKSGINREFRLSCRAIGVRPPLELSHSLVQFGSTAVGDRTTARIHVINSHTGRNGFSHPVPRVGEGPVAPVGPRLFSFAPPDTSEITLTPSTGRVLPGQRCLIQVTFRPALCDEAVRAEAVRLVREGQRAQQDPQRSDTEVSSSKRSDPEPRAIETATESCTSNSKEDSKKGRRAPNRASGKQRVKERSSSESLGPKSDSPPRDPHLADVQRGTEEYAAGRASLLRSFERRQNRYIIPCFVSDGDKEEPSHSPHNTLYLELHCPAVRPSLVVTSDGGKTTVDFSQVAVGQKVTKKVTIQNISQESVRLESSVLDLSGPFVLLNATRAVEPGATHEALLAFTPPQGKKYRETLEIRSRQMTLEFTLQGEGVDPLLTCSHEGKVMNFGYVLEKESTTQVFQLQNASPLAISFSVLLDSQCLHKRNQARQQLPTFLYTHTPPHRTVGTLNYSGRSVFLVAPTGGAIPPGKTQEITVSFMPDHESVHYLDTLCVQLMNKKTVCVLELRGAARRHAMFVCGGDPLDALPESLVPPLNIDDSANIDGEMPATPLLLTLRSVLRDGAASLAQGELEVGCMRCTRPVAKRNVEFSFENLPTLQQKGFSVEPSEGTVDPGQRRKITVTWAPPSGLKPNEVVQARAPLCLRGDGTELYSVNLVALVVHSTVPNP